MPDTQDLILAELRSLREDFNTFARQTGERIASLESDNHSFMGNGQMGRVSSLEQAVAKLNQWRWWVIGAAAGGSGVVSVIAWVIAEMSR